MTKSILMDRFYNKFGNSILSKAGLLMWVILGILSFIYAEERATFMDGSFQLFDMINEEAPSIHHYRFTNPLIQILPVIAIKLHFSLDSIMVAYSMNVWLFQLSIFLILLYYFKNNILAFVHIGVFTFFTTDSFVFITPEFYQGIGLLLIWVALVLKHKTFESHSAFILMCLLVIPIIFDHFLLSGFIIFMWIYLFLHEASIRSSKYYILLAFICLVTLIRMKYFNSWYDINRQGHFWRNYDKYYPNFHTIPGHLIFIKAWLGRYYMFPLLLALICISFCKKSIFKSIKHPWLKTLLLSSFIFTYTLINHINDPLTPFIFYTEVNYLGYLIPILILLSFDVLRLLDHRWVFGVIAVLLMVRVVPIIQSCQKMETRNQWILSKLDESERDKNLVHSKDIPKDILIQTWSIPESSLILSTARKTKPQTMLIVNNTSLNRQYISDVNFFLRAQSELEIDAINDNYFKFSDSKYKLIESIKTKKD